MFPGSRAFTLIYAMPNAALHSPRFLSVIHDSGTMDDPIFRRCTMRTLLFTTAATLLAATAFTVHADTLKSETEVRQLADKVMTAAGKGQTDDAYAAMTPYTLTDVNTLDRARLSARTSRMQLEQTIGGSVGYEFIRSEKVGESLLKLVYIEKAEKQAIPWQFIFYKTGSGWALSNFSNGDNINSLFTR
jgi:hypothetical protein